MPKLDGVIAIAADQVPPKTNITNYPAPFAPRVAGRLKRALGDAFGLTHYGVNLTRLAPGSVSALRHSHGLQEEFIYILEGSPVLVTDEGETPLAPGMCAGFPAGTGNAHQLVNRSAADVVYLEVGDRLPGDTVEYPDDDLAARMGPDGRWIMTRKDGSAY